ncbi:MAG: DUF3489 domain-containing protein [Pseudomonadota bacterium]
MSDTTESEGPNRKSRQTDRKQAGKPTPTLSAKLRITKKVRLETLLARTRGATLAQLQKELGWQPHSVRAAISGLRKAGRSIELRESNGRKVYRLAA